MLNSLFYYRHNSESDSYLHLYLLPRNRDYNAASKGSLCHFGDVIAMGFKLRLIQKLGIRHSLDLRL